MIVVDTNIVSYLYIFSEHSEQSERLLAFDSDWVAPTLWRSEYRNVLALHLRKNLLGLDEVLLIIHQAEKIFSHGEYEISSAHIMQLVASSNCSAYDCEFVALAQHLNVPLITADKQLLSKFPNVAGNINSYIA